MTHAVKSAPRHAVLALLAATCWLAPAAAEPGLIVGVADDSVRWSDRSADAVAVARDLGLQALRITVPWHPGETSLDPIKTDALDHAITASFGMRLVVAVYGGPNDAPRTEAARTEYCAYVADLLDRYPTVNDVVIWNEPNLSRFWRPQFGPRGRSVAPTHYASLLGRCWDVLHAARPDVNVISASSPRGNDRPLARNNVSHSPVSWYRQLAAAYRVSGRSAPIFDTVGHNAYPASPTEMPWTAHPRSTAIGQGDLGKLVSILGAGFAATPQPVPGVDGVSIWIMEQGFQSAVDPAKAAAYQGFETVRSVLPSGALEGALMGWGRPHSSQVADSVRFAYCQPAVDAIFTFLLADEADLGGWQSGVLWADWTPKPAYDALKEAIGEVGRDAIDCDRFR
jgi:hypothetical protein